jgi:hypothetical protein
MRLKVTARQATLRAILLIFQNVSASSHRFGNDTSTPARSMDTYHNIVIATPIDQLYKVTSRTAKTIATRLGKISDTIEEIGNID